MLSQHVEFDAGGRRPAYASRRAGTRSPMSPATESRTIFDTPVVAPLLKRLSLGWLRVRGWQVQGAPAPEAALPPPRPGRREPRCDGFDVPARAPCVRRGAARQPQDPKTTPPALNPSADRTNGAATIAAPPTVNGTTIFFSFEFHIWDSDCCVLLSLMSSNLKDIFDLHMVCCWSCGIKYVFECICIK